MIEVEVKDATHFSKKSHAMIDNIIYKIIKVDGNKLTLETSGKKLISCHKCGQSRQTLRKVGDNKYECARRCIPRWRTVSREELNKLKGG